MWGISSHFWIEEVDFGRVCFILHLSRIFVEVSRDHVSVIFVVLFLLRLGTCALMSVYAWIWCRVLVARLLHSMSVMSCVRRCHVRVLGTVTLPC